MTSTTADYQNIQPGWVIVWSSNFTAWTPQVHPPVPVLLTVTINQAFQVKNWICVQMINATCSMLADKCKLVIIRAKLGRKKTSTPCNFQESQWRIQKSRN